jgi:hypothetical protein
MRAMLIMDPPAVVPAQFASPVAVAQSAGALDATVAVNASGATLVAYRDADGRLHVRDQVVSEKYAQDSHVALADDGSAAVLWLHIGPHGKRQLELRTAAPGQPFGPVRRLVSVTANLVAEQVLAAGGRFVTVWWQGVPGHDHAVRYAVGSGPVRILDRVDGCCAVSSVAGPDGSVLATWTAPHFGAALVATLTPGATRFTAPKQLARDAPFSEAFAGPGGVRVSLNPPHRSPFPLELAAPPAAPVVVTRVAQNRKGTLDIEGPTAAIPATGGTVATWTIRRASNPESETYVAGELDAAVQQSDGTFGGPTRLTAPSEFPDDATVAQTAATTSTAIVAWNAHHALRYSVHTAAGFTPTRTLASHAPGFALSASATTAAVVWVDAGTVWLSTL